LLFLINCKITFSLYIDDISLMKRDYALIWHILDFKKHLFYFKIFLFIENNHILEGTFTKKPQILFIFKFILSL